MSRIAFQGPMRDRIASFVRLNAGILQTSMAHARGRRMAPDWDILTEAGIRFVRAQFTHAMTGPDIAAGRVRFNSLTPMTKDVYDVESRDISDPPARLFTPTRCETDAVLFYCHGGGYTFRGPVTDRFARMLAHHTRARVYMPLYRLTPEHPHPAQAEDALAGWRAVTLETPADQIVVIGDSAGGHMALMLLQNLKAHGMAQPALCIGLCPWTDIGARGDSLHGNDPYDLVQGWMALQFGRWLDPEGRFGREALSPIYHDYQGLAPIYLQAGGREVLRDMIVDFARVQAGHGALVQLDLWGDMPHEFQAYDSTKEASRQALERIVTAFRGAVSGAGYAALPGLVGVSVETCGAGGNS